MVKDCSFILSICFLLVFLIYSGSTGKENPETETNQHFKSTEDKRTIMSFSGDVQYRIRADIIMDKGPNGVSLPTQADHQHRYAWNLMANAAISENVFIGMRLSNPSGYITDDIVDNLKTTKELLESPKQFLAVPEMYFNWNVGIVNLSAGVIPVLSNTVLSLAGYEEKGFMHATGSWKDKMNNSQTGINLGFDIIDRGEITFAFNTIYAIAKGVGETDAMDALKNEQLRLIFSSPVNILKKKLSFAPVMHLRTNMHRSSVSDEANHSLVGGIDIDVNLNKRISFGAGFAAGGNRNDCFTNDSGYIAEAPLGFLTDMKLKVNPGYGKGNVSIKISNARDREDSLNRTYTMFRWDIRYGFPIKGITIMPRLRVWYGFNNLDEETLIKLRPALILICKFK
ncbi:hypothetical protein ACFL5S_00620 [Fibrobacterota bacterium]